MRRSTLLLLTVALGGCSFLTSFDPAGQPCDSTGACLAGYVCVDNRCVGGDGGAAGDAGTGGGGGQQAAFEQNCSDGIDEDGDSRIDCLDPDCTGRSCEDGDRCTTGETCQASACSGGQAKACTTPGTCQVAVGATCNRASGECEYPAGADGQLCGSTAAARCCGGACVDLSTDPAHCGGCGLACAAGAACESLAQSTCGTPGPTSTSARCTCAANLVCPGGQACTGDARCSPTLAANCATGQRVVTVTGCASYCTY